MSLVQIIDFSDSTSNLSQWNSMANHPMQSFEWAIIRKSHGITVQGFIEYTGDRKSIKNVMLMTIHKIPHSKYHIGYVPKSTIPSIDMLKAIQKIIVKKYNLIFVKFEPDVFVSSNLNLPESFHKSSHPIFTKHNQILDITRNIDDLMSSLHHKTRYNIRLAEKKGVTIKIMNNDEGYKIFEKLYFETCARQKYRGHTRSYHRAIWALLHSTQTDNSLCSNIMVAFYKGMPLAVYQLWNYKRKMYYVYGGSSTDHRETMSPNLLMWKSIEYAKSLGCTEFDMWGSLAKEYDPQDPWSGFTRFKSGYGTKFVEYAGSYDVIYKQLPYKIYNLIHKVRQKLI